MDLDYTLRVDEPAKLTDKSTAEEKSIYEKWERSNRMSLMIIKHSISDTIRGAMPEEENAKKFLSQIADRFVASEKVEAYEFQLLHHHHRLLPTRRQPPASPTHPPTTTVKHFPAINDHREALTRSLAATLASYCSDLIQASTTQPQPTTVEHSVTTDDHHEALSSYSRHYSPILMY
ncbi:hypothetical protein Vadar_015129 [Vaccinium darrowii]|uniref:Uncharacterized protein n=1 Tax=Vaccinium darrowii TaxID=229202 RepID=A0ACB7Z4P5_9ERIC|nr:hypothetical protein Vadar_015129 [Vaccinium darrowii]